MRSRINTPHRGSPARTARFQNQIGGGGWLFSIRQAEYHGARIKCQRAYRSPTEAPTDFLVSFGMERTSLNLTYWQIGLLEKLGIAESVYAPGLDQLEATEANSTRNLKLSA